MQHPRILLKTLPVQLVFGRILEEQLDQIHTKLRTKRNENLDLKAQLQPTPEARAENKELGRGWVFVVRSRFAMSPVYGTYACAVARQDALTIQFIAKFGNDSAKGDHEG